MRASRFIGSALLVVAACKGEREAPVTGSAAGGSGSAVAAAPSDGAVADAGVACVPRGTLVSSTADQLRICSDDTKACIAVDPKTGAARTVAYDETEPPELAYAAPEVRDGKTVVCFKDRCRPIGPRGLAIVESEKDDSKQSPEATVDLATLVVSAGEDGPQLWDLAKDRRIELAPPGPEHGLATLRAVGNHIVAEWTPSQERVYASNGKLVGDLAAEGTQLAMLDDTRWVALTRDHLLHVYGDRPQRVEIEPSVGYGDWEPGGAMTVLADKTVATVLVRPGEASVVLVDPARGAVFARWPLTRCP